MADRLDALEAELRALRKQLDPQRLRQALERTWDPRGGEPRVIDADGKTLDYEGSIQFLNATSVVDAAGRRIVVTPTGGGGGGGHVIIDPVTAAPMPAEPNLYLVSADSRLTITGADVPPYTALIFALSLPPNTDVQVFDGSLLGPGAQTWTRPSPAPESVEALIIGAGAGGGDGAVGGAARGGGGGGAGGFRRLLLDASVLGATAPVMLGTPGAAGTGAGDGADATVTYFLADDGSEVPAKGGTAAGSAGAGAICTNGHDGGAGGAGGNVATAADGARGARGNGGSAGGGAGGANRDLGNPPVLGGDAGATANSASAPVTGWTGWPGGSSDPLSSDPGPWFGVGSGGAGGSCSGAAGVFPAGDGGHALVVVISHL